MTILAERLADKGIRLKAYSLGTQRILCPNCSSTRKNAKDPCLSVTIDDEGAAYQCWHCGFKGGVHDREELRRNSQGYSSPSRPYRDEIDEEQTSWPAITTLLPWASEYMQDRGISLEVLSWAGVGCAQAYYAKHKRAIASLAFVYRQPGAAEAVNVKFRTPQKDITQVKGGKQVLYLLDKVDRSISDSLIITEGEIDALSFWQAKIPNAVSVPNGAPQKVGAGPIDPEHDRKYGFLWDAKEFLEQFPKIVIAADADDNGRALTEELCRRIGRERCWLMEYPAGCKDANDVLRQCGPEALTKCLEEAKPHPVKNVFLAESYKPDVMALYEGHRKPKFSAGWASLDTLFQVREGELSVVTGYPGSGKSQFTDGMAVNLARRYGWRFAVCSFENPPDEHIAKLAEQYTGRPFWDGFTPKMSKTDVEFSIDWINQHFYFVRAEDESPTIDWLLEAAAGAVLRYGVRGLIIDPYNELEHKRPGNQTETEYVSQMLAKVKRFAMARGVHVWFIAHPIKPFKLKDGGVHPLSLYDISGSANWNNKADLGIVVTRHLDSHEVTIDVKKVRFRQVGKMGTCRLAYDPACGRYNELPAQAEGRD